VVLPVHNEARNLEAILPALAAVRPAVHEIIVVDGDSADDSVHVARTVAPSARVITQTRRGKGNALACGFAAATGDVIVALDADGSADPAAIPALVSALLGGADFATGSRFASGGAGVTPPRGSRSATLNGVANMLFGTSHTDLCYGFSAFWADVLPVFDLPSIAAPPPADHAVWCDGPEIETVLGCRIAAAGMTITEVPATPTGRRTGPSNLRTFADRWQVLRTLLAEHRRAARRKPDRRKPDRRKPDRRKPDRRKPDRRKPDRR
jgi:glycosyltransferase involved in cell wall biosynthesis